MTPPPPPQPGRDLPISLQGIETILRYFARRGFDEESIRTISETTHLSMRVTKNILLHLEQLNQVEQVFERGDIIPKWRITKLGLHVAKNIKEGEATNSTANLTQEFEDLLQNIRIPDTLDQIREAIKRSQNPSCGN